MAETETLQQFYQNKFQNVPECMGQELGHFNVFKIDSNQEQKTKAIKYSRRDFYKISLLRGKAIYNYADKSIEVDGTTLIFFNPQVPYTIEYLSEERSGFFCIFKESFFSEILRNGINELPMFAIGGKPAYILTTDQDTYVSNIFEKAIAEINSDYRFKYDLLRNYVTEMIHYAMKIEPSETLYRHPDANSRITAVFTELLERQFPIESPAQRFNMRSAKDFADQLAIHVNHLNRAIRRTTGKTTTDHIFERLTSEAKALLKHTNWNISEISYSLGFEEPTHFNNFFKKHTQTTPSAFRIV
ncbi:helix-turn-helix domain-containing protein [Mucilaginibacter sp. X4EP1]|uniref:helix-turn-helix domain-containing protein n=1 Tax=Mucilaginibacter sp. X4EP1 TaxID=2723092 RepID=UPI002168CEA3|nr:helix-turn-helix transcriptional regulator [Mucilaginibacter sp. X4EP1]MCS3815420.1 AraC-like DNA-binding protein [Mucilaginibacter sp. X4EP1]